MGTVTSSAAEKECGHLGSLPPFPSPDSAPGLVPPICPKATFLGPWGPGRRAAPPIAVARGVASATRKLEAEANTVIALVDYPEDSPIFEGNLGPGQAEAKSVASHMKKLAASTHKEAWSKLKKEFLVQCQMWEGAALMQAAGDAAKSKRRSVDSSETTDSERLTEGQWEQPPQAQPSEAVLLRREMERVLENCLLPPAAAVVREGRAGTPSSATTTPSSAADELQAILQKEAEAEADGAREALLSKSVLEAAQLCLESLPLVERRRRLARRLQLAASSGVRGAAGAGARKEGLEERQLLEHLVVDCQLEEGRLELCARRALGLSLDVVSVFWMRRLRQRDKSPEEEAARRLASEKHYGVAADSGDGSTEPLA